MKRAFPLPALLACLILSGSGSLVLEVTWSRLLKLVFGSTTLAISTILVAYMLGLGLGGLLGGSLSRRLRNGVRAYGLFEIGIGLYAFLVPLILEVFPAITRGWLADMNFWPVAIIRFFLVLVLLLLPTLGMGATLPVLVAALGRDTPELSSRAGLLYGINTLGAVLGTVGAAFFLFPALGLRSTNAIGGAMDMAAGLIALFLLAPRLEPGAAEPEAVATTGAASPEPAVGDTPATVTPDAAPLPAASALPTGWARWNPVLLTYTLVGFTALVYEVCWTRVLAMILGSSIYAFAVMLATFLAGISFGSLLAARWFNRFSRPVGAYGLGLALLGFLSLLTMQAFGWLGDIFLALMQWTGPSTRVQVLVHVVVSVLVMLAPTLVLGALFPLATRAAGTRRSDGGRLVGDIYFTNTLGSATGAFVAGFLLIPAVGLRLTLTWAIALNLLAAAAVLLWHGEWVATRRQATASVLAVVALVLVVLPPPWNEVALTRGIYYKPLMLMEWGLPLRPMAGIGVPLAEKLESYRDGLNATVSIHTVGGNITMRINGKPDASLTDMATQVLSGHIPMLFGSEAREICVIGYASGVTAGAISLHEPAALDVVEIEPAVIEASRTFDPYNQRPLEQKNVRTIIEDGRHHLARSTGRYDLIVSEPSNPWISGAANLFTREFFTLAHEALKPGGRLLQWIQLYNIDRTGFQSVLKAVQSEFSHVYGFWSQTNEFDLLMLATDRPLTPADLPRWDELPEAVQNDLRRVKLFSEKQLWALMRLSTVDTEEMTRDASIVNTDDNMHVELNLPYTKNTNPFEDWPFPREQARGISALWDEAAPPDGQTLGLLAVAYIQDDDEYRARALLGRVPDCERWSACLTATGLLAREGDTGTAMAYFNRALELDPDLVEARIARARTRALQRNFPAALTDIDAALAGRPLDYLALHLRMNIRAALKQLQAARDDARILADRDLVHWSWSLQADAAAAAAAMGLFDEATTEMQAYLEQTPLDDRGWGLLARMFRDLSQAEKQAVAVQNQQDARFNLAVLRHRRARQQLFLDPDKKMAPLLRSILNTYPEYEPAAEELNRLAATGR